MKQKIYTQILFVGCAMLFSPLSTLAAEKPITLEKLQEDKDFELTCGCAVTNRKGDFLVFSGPTERASAIVKIDGKKRTLRWVSSTESSRAPRVGDTFYRRYREGSTKMRINYKTAEVCAPNDDSCEVTDYSVDIQLEKGARKNHIRSLKGQCGC